MIKLASMAMHAFAHYQIRSLKHQAIQLVTILVLPYKTPERISPMSKKALLFGLVVVLFLAATLTAVAEEPQIPPDPIRINVGGNRVVVPGKGLFYEPQYYGVLGWGITDPYRAFSDPDLQIWGTSSEAEDTLYRWQARASWGTDSIHIPVKLPPGMYRIRLGFVEHMTVPCQHRKFDAIISYGGAGDEWPVWPDWLFKDIDVTCETGHWHTLLLKERVVHHRGGSTRIFFEQDAGLPAILGSIEIIYLSPPVYSTYVPMVSLGKEPKQ